MNERLRIAADRAVHRAVLGADAVNQGAAANVMLAAILTKLGELGDELRGLRPEPPAPRDTALADALRELLDAGDTYRQAVERDLRAGSGPTVTSVGTRDAGLHLHRARGRALDALTGTYSSAKWVAPPGASADSANQWTERAGGH